MTTFDGLHEYLIKDKRMETMKNLLSQVSVIIQQYEKVAELTDENFNIFNILKSIGNVYEQAKNR